MTDGQPMDIEIYVQNLSLNEAETWLSQTLTSIKATKKKKGMPKQAFSFQGSWQEATFLIVVYENVAPNFTSIWFDSKALPWNDDEECAKKAALALDRNVRVTAGGWQQQDDPDAWLEISPSGTTTDIKWKT